MINRRKLIAGGLGAAALAPMKLRAQTDRTIRIGVITDMSGVYKDLSGPTSVACTRQPWRNSPAPTRTSRSRSS